ncbi:M23 family metallopeptidase [Legionella fairfieldensis]|uniref:M23 family metallopeptidase n=1 Tax=Legionella fairfieldensis TaxID=45064 RepID=UPI00048B058D|nr:peptidoglycan DD-metalloendopeptidase family protein [Legionella fairfieldensis]
MDQRPNVSLENSAKPSKLLALIALVIACALPFILVKSFPHKKAERRQLRLSTPHKKIPTEAPVNSLINQQTIPPNSSATKQTLNKSSVGLKLQESIKNKSVETHAAPPEIKKPVVSAGPEPKDEWKIIKTRRGDSFATVFNRLGLKPQTLQTIMRDNSRYRDLLKLKPNQQLQVLIKNKLLEKVIIPYSTTQYVLLYREGLRYNIKLNTHKMDVQNQFITATVRDSLYSTAKRHNIPYKLIQQMTEIFAWEINFAKEVRTGDQFSIIYKASYVGDKLVSTGDIVAVSYKNRGKLFQATQHTTKTGRSDYFNPQGTSLKKAFNRYPLRFSHISSTFSLARNHPILRYKRPHKGVDLAAPIGTPILATGDGRIEVIGRQSGYGNMIKIKHDKKHSTIYGHMLKFQKGLSKGTYVRRGQVIGYVGQTGLATGPHCHYEFHINQQPKNPTTVELPHGESIPAREMAAFKANANTLLAQLKLFEMGRLANANKRTLKTG